MFAANLPKGQFGYCSVRSNGVNPEQGFSVQGNIANTNVGLFIQDAWSINDRLTLNLGLRTENESVPSYTTADGIAPVAIKWGFGEKLLPLTGGEPGRQRACLKAGKARSTIASDAVSVMRKCRGEFMIAPGITNTSRSARAFQSRSGSPSGHLLQR